MSAGELRRKLRAHGHALRPIVQVGKGGVTKGLLEQLAIALHDHELVKVKIGSECPVDRFAVADALGAQPGTNIVQLVGRVALVYKRHPQKPRFEGPASRPASERPPEVKPKPSTRRSKSPRRRTGRKRSQ
jgi:RNA-binding protein